MKIGLRYSRVAEPDFEMFKEVEWGGLSGTHMKIGLRNVQYSRVAEPDFEIFKEVQLDH